jgi:hypothetical protein
LQLDGLLFAAGVGLYLDHEVREVDVRFRAAGAPFDERRMREGFQPNAGDTTKAGLGDV